MWDLIFGIGCIAIALAALMASNERLFRMLSFGRKSRYDPESKPIKGFLTLIRFLFVLLLSLGVYIVIVTFFP
ncbi:MAG: hypothetical protein PHP22_03035 [Oscillospiraceae bacterium]|jgi:hypothetical protein|nr:hypothetical protein [Oscillospiraceae bacterium]